MLLSSVTLNVVQDDKVKHTVNYIVKFYLRLKKNNQSDFE